MERKCVSGQRVDYFASEREVEDVGGMDLGDDVVDELVGEVEEWRHCLFSCAERE